MSLIFSSKKNVDLKVLIEKLIVENEILPELRNSRNKNIKIRSDRRNLNINCKP